MTEEQYNTIRQWQDATFIHATPLSCANHLQEEVNELILDLKSKEKGFEEIADCFLLLVGVCNKSGLSYNDITTLIDTKMKVNYSRSWGNVNDKGYVKHIEKENP